MRGHSNLGIYEGTASNASTIPATLQGPAPAACRALQYPDPSA